MKGKSPGYTLSPYEQKIEALVDTIAAQHKDKLTYRKGLDDYEYSWEIKPHNSKAAKAYVYGVDEYTVNITVDDYYWIEVFMRPKKWDEDFKIIGQYLNAIIEGRITGWRKSRTNEVFSDPSILEFNIDGRPSAYTANLWFGRQFKKNPRTRRVDYEPY